MAEGHTPRDGDKEEEEGKNDRQRQAEEVLRSAWQNPPNCPICLEQCWHPVIMIGDDHCFQPYCFVCLCAWTEYGEGCPTCRSHPYEYIYVDGESNIQTRSLPGQEKRRVPPTPPPSPQGHGSNRVRIAIIVEREDQRVIIARYHVVREEADSRLLSMGPHHRLTARGGLAGPSINEPDGEIDSNSDQLVGPVAHRARSAWIRRRREAMNDIVRAMSLHTGEEPVGGGSNPAVPIDELERQAAMGRGLNRYADAVESMGTIALVQGEEANLVELDLSITHQGGGNEVVRASRLVEDPNARRVPGHLGGRQGGRRRRNPRSRATRRLMYPNDWMSPRARSVDDEFEDQIEAEYMRWASPTESEEELYG